jgi:hypothetical protein
MILRLAERLDVPLRDRNRMLTAAGYAPLFPARSLEHPALDIVRQAIDVVLSGHEPYPAIAIDRHWTLVSSNAAVLPLWSNIDAPLLEAPVNVLRLTRHPGGLASRIANYSQWRQHVFEQGSAGKDRAGCTRILLHGAERGLSGDDAMVD